MLGPTRSTGMGFFLYRKRQVLVQFLNTVGTFFQMVFISLLINCAMPLRCFDHPTSSKSVSEMPAVLCFAEGQHTWLLVVALVSFLAMPLPFVVASIWATLVYPARLLEDSARGRNFMLATQFLFSRFAPKSHAYSILVLLKSFILAMVPVVFQAGVVLQSCFLGFALLGFCCPYLLILDKRVVVLHSCRLSPVSQG